MANEQLAPITMPRAPSASNDVAALARWARDLQSALAFGLQRIVTALNSGAELSGEWVPGVSGDGSSGTASYAHRRGRWSLLGQEVTMWGDVQVNSFSSFPAGNLRIHNLPFLHDTATPETVGVLVPRSGLTLTSGYTQVAAVLQTNSQIIRFLEFGSGQTAQLVQATALSLPLRLEVFLHYRKRSDAVAATV
jgi:hypothetical protein